MSDEVKILAGQGRTVTVPSKSKWECVSQMALPGVVIFVHGVNSDGEWYDAAEMGLCAGLNQRLGRTEAKMEHFTIEGGVMAQASYTSEVTSAGLINPKLNGNTFIKDEPNYSPVIRFRWGYRADAEELKEFGGNVWLNEKNYWGGGPFANGCSNLVDLWEQGLNDHLFLWLTTQHLNPAVGRDVYGCPPRAYYVHAAQRLALLIAQIRKKQADVPITIVCHSQGNMVSLAAAYLGDNMPEVSDGKKSSKAVADTYVLCNPPYSLLKENGTENWVNSGIKDNQGRRGRITYDARCQTLSNLFDIMRTRIAHEQDASKVNNWAGNTAPKDHKDPFDATQDRNKHGLSGHTLGRVTLYCNPHDAVISASPVQGIGWRGVSAEDIAKCNGAGVFTQRVFAQRYVVGQPPGQSYRYWEDHYDTSAIDHPERFWHPASPKAKYFIGQGLEARHTVLGWISTLLFAPLMIVLIDVTNAFSNALCINGFPDKGWKIPIDAPELPETFKPCSHRYAKAEDAGTENFDEDMDPPTDTRDANKPQEAMNPNDPYDAAEGNRLGNADTEAHQRYEDRARLRMMARRDGKADDHNQVVGEDDPSQASPDYQRWRDGKVVNFLKEGVDQIATDHSTIMTNPMHAIKALAYDVAIGYSKLSAKDWTNFRIEADWRFVGSLSIGGNPNARFDEYIQKGTLDDLPLHQHPDYKADKRPDTVVDERESGILTYIASAT